jgi:hypothetical protein
MGTEDKKKKQTEEFDLVDWFLAIDSCLAH